MDAHGGGTGGGGKHYFFTFHVSFGFSYPDLIGSVDPRRPKCPPKKGKKEIPWFEQELDGLPGRMQQASPEA